MEKELTLQKLEETLGDRFIPMYKTVPPYMKYKKGFGFLGVLLWDTQEDLIQCHLCGLWFKQLNPHIGRKHNITSNKYREMLGFYRSMPLSSVGTTKKRHKAALKNKKAIRKMMEGGKKFTFGNGVNKPDHSWRKIYAFKNQHGICEAQLGSRLKNVIDQNGNDKIAKTNPNLYNALRRKFGTMDEALIFYGYKRKSIFYVIKQFLNK